MSQSLVLLSGAAENVDGDSFRVGNTGWFVARMYGTFNGTTVNIETQGDDGSSTEWIEIPDTSQTSAWAGRVFLEKSARVRATTTGGSSTSVTVTLNPA
jgi:hypothetical protein